LLAPHTQKFKQIVLAKNDPCPKGKKKQVKVTSFDLVNLYMLSKADMSIASKIQEYG